MADPLSVHLYPVVVAPPTGNAKHMVVPKIREMSSELQHLQSAVSRMQHAVISGDSRTLVSAVMDSRNWALSLVESHCYIQRALYSGGGASGASHPGGQCQLLFNRAVKAGVERAELNLQLE